MKNKEYQLINSTIDDKYQTFEKMSKPSSVAFWTKMAKSDEKFGCIVTMNFEYSTKTNEVIMTRYEAKHLKSNDKTIIRLIKK